MRIEASRSTTVLVYSLVATLLIVSGTMLALGVWSTTYTAHAPTPGSSVPAGDEVTGADPEPEVQPEPAVERTNEERRAAMDVVVPTGIDDGGEVNGGGGGETGVDRETAMMTDTDVFFAEDEAESSPDTSERADTDEDREAAMQFTIPTGPSSADEVNQ